MLSSQLPTCALFSSTPLPLDNVHPSYFRYVNVDLTLKCSQAGQIHHRFVICDGVSQLYSSEMLP